MCWWMFSDADALQEHVIEFWEDSNPGFHNLLAIKYKDRILEVIDTQQAENQQVQGQLQTIIILLVVNSC